MSTEIKCPNCGHEFEPTDSIREEVQKELRSKMAEWQKQQQQKFDMQLMEEKKKTQQQTEETIRKSIASDFENKLRMLEENNKDTQEKLKLAREKEIEFLKKEQALLSKEQELDLQLQKMLLEERNKLAEVIRKEEAEKISLRETEYQLKNRELEEKLEAQKKLVDEMKRKSEQGSMQLQGEAQELILEDLLRQSFPYDSIEEVGKGVKGADCILVVRNKFGQECGKIIFESKRTKDFSDQWIEKLKADMRSQAAVVAVIVTQAMPKGMDRFGEKDGVWVCSFAEVKALTYVLRDGIVRIAQATTGQENKGEKMHMLYDYLTGNEFAEQWKAIREGFMSMKMSIQKERDAMEKLWKQREKQLEKVLLNAAHIRGSVEGIAGTDVNINLLEDEDNDQLTEE
ncbi:DUF2130 domain-containing protein [Lacibacter sp. H407]|uniref:DUF2130 domain-containing protein n=1 Tax=Lacibacter sp. H407 TaxID=3133423 RepID=UPI0030C1827A